MARLNDELSLAWRSLAGANDQSEGWRSSPISQAGATTLHAGRKFPGGYEALLARFDAATLPAAMHLPEGSGFRVERAQAKGNGLAWLALTRTFEGSIELFTAMVRDIASAIDTSPANEAGVLATFLGRVRAWQEFMRKGACRLKAESEVGLFGELTVLRAIIEAGVDATDACRAWQGPLGGVRDFEIGIGGIEVKTTLSSTGFPARVGSLEQLDDSVRQPLFVGGLRLLQVESGSSLPDAVESMRDIVRGEHVAERLLAERIIASGYLDYHASQYIRRFTLSDKRLFLVNDYFPRLTPTSVPSGVTWATYKIDLNTVPGAFYSLAEALRELKIL